MVREGGRWADVLQKTVLVAYRLVALYTWWKKTHRTLEARIWLLN